MIKKRWISGFTAMHAFSLLSVPMLVSAFRFKGKADFFARLAIGGAVLASPKVARWLKKRETGEDVGVIVCSICKEVKMGNKCGCYNISEM